MKKKNRKILTGAVSVVLVLAVIAAVILVPKLRRDPVLVLSVNEVSYPGYGSGGGESFGQVTTDKVQTIFVSGTQVVTEIKVYEGQEVKKGDVLYTYDTTLSDLAVERKDLAVQQMEINLKDAKKELRRLNGLRPMVIPKPTTPPPTEKPQKEDYSISPKEPEKLNTAYAGKGTAREPFYFWLGDKNEVTDAEIERMWESAKGTPSAVYVVFQITEGNRAATPFDSQYGVRYTRELTGEDPVPPVTEPEQTEPSESTEPAGTEPPETTQPTESVPTEPEPPAETEPTGTEPEASAPMIAPTEAPTEPTEAPTEPSAGTTPASGGSPEARNASGRYRYKMSFFDHTKLHKLPEPPHRDEPEFDMGSGYTQTELVAMRNQKKEEIKELQFNIRMGKAELKIMKKEPEDGNAKAEFDGVVVSVLEPLTAREQNLPMIKVAGGGGYFVEGSITELELEQGSVQVGQSVTINSWDNGMVYEGTIAEIGRYPVENQDYYGSGAANMSYYPYRVFIDESADLMEGSYVSMSYQAEAETEGLLCLDNAFLLSEGKRSYVYVRSAEGLLEKRYVQTGASQDGYATPILAGLTTEDFIAFPYGKNVSEGAPTVEGTMEDLYKG